MKMYTLLPTLNFNFLILKFVISQVCSTSKILNCYIMLYDNNHQPIHLYYSISPNNFCSFSSSKLPNLISIHRLTSISSSYKILLDLFTWMIYRHTNPACLN